MGKETENLLSQLPDLAPMPQVAGDVQFDRFDVIDDRCCRTPPPPFFFFWGGGGG